MNVTRFSMQSGRVQFFREQAPEPTRTSSSESVTINIIDGRPAVPAHYQVSFTITVDHEEQGLAIQHVFELTQVVLNGDDFAPYRKIESQAARHLAPMLRSVADRIEEEVAEFDQRQKPAD